MTQHLTDSQMMTPRHTLLRLLIDQAHESGLSLEIAQSLASVDMHGVADVWRLA